MPDTLDGRFDLILLHLFLFMSLPHAQEDKVMRRLLLESLFDDMDRSLREMGVGDMGISRRIKSMSKAAFGRLKAYSGAGESDDALREALIRNVYRGNTPQGEPLGKLVTYVRNWQPPSPSAEAVA